MIELGKRNVTARPSDRASSTASRSKFSVPWMLTSWAVSGANSPRVERSAARWKTTEISNSLISRSSKLPVPVDAGKVNASFKNGLLTITLPKTLAAKGTMIPVKEG